MHYTIGDFKETQGNLNVNFDKTGNQYLVGLYNKETKEYTHNTFNTMEEALERFINLTKFILQGYYNEKQKREYLLKGEIK